MTITNNRHILLLATFCKVVIHKLAPFFRTSVKYIYSIDGVNGRNAKCIYNRALLDSRFYKIKYYLCKKADSRIFNSNVTAPIITTQLQSPQGLFSVSPCVDSSHNSIVLNTQNNTDAGTGLVDNTSTCTKMNTTDNRQYTQFEVDE